MYNSIAITSAKKEIISNRTVIGLIGTLLFMALTALGAHVYIPLSFTPVPITLQTFFVLLSGALLGKRLGPLSQSLYIAMGATGAGIFFSGSSGLAYIMGPTGGYLIGFVVATYLMGRILRNRDSLAAIIIAMVIGELTILSFGVLWLCAGLKFSLNQAIYMGAIPFIAGDIVKLLAASLICNRYLGRAKRLFY